MDDLYYNKKRTYCSEMAIEIICKHVEIRGEENKSGSKSKNLSKCRTTCTNRKNNSLQPIYL